jgi:hypothetical protein
MPGRPASGILCNEGGFVLAFVLFLLAVCTLMGFAASQTSIDEIDISANEVVTRKVYTMALSGLPLAAIPLMKTQGRGDAAWASASLAEPVYLNNKNPELTADDGTVAIIDGFFLSEGREQDESYETGWNNSGKYCCNGKEAAYKPIDDPFMQKTKDGGYCDDTIDRDPDLRIRSEKQFTLDIDVDKSGVGYQAGGVAEFGSGAEGSGGTAYQLSYVLNCQATMPGKQIGSATAPIGEMVLGYRFLPDSGM